ncbi:MAG TPA: hypothetical protein VMI55_03685 [Thermoplasmata archaeon]|nr:hypothetical protein [Thermoplasmata archaeon]
MNRKEQIGRLLPAPLAAIVILLVALILLTPILLSSGQPAPGILTQAELIVDRVPGSDVTHFYVRGVGTTTRYSEMSIEWAANFTWSTAFPTGTLNWSVGANLSDVLAAVFATSANPVALNVSALYQVSGSSTLYIGVLAFEVSGGGTSGTDLLSSVTDTPGLAGPAPVSLSNLPLTIPLVNVGAPP